jgi:hypothetical protein
MPDDSSKPEASGAAESVAMPDCPGRPALAVAAEGWILLMTDSGNCFRVSSTRDLAMHRLPDLEGCSAVDVDAAGRLCAGLYDGMIAIPRDDEWSYHATDAVVLSLAATPWGLAVGDASGSVTLRDPPGPEIARALLGEAVVDLLAFDEGVVALGARGGLWRLEKPHGGVFSAASVSTNEALGRPVGLFRTGNRSKVGVYSVERLALLGHGKGRLTVGIRRFADGINKVVPFGPIPGKGDSLPLGLLTDSGQVWFVDADLKTVASVVLPGESKVVGVASGPSGRLLAWTGAGSVFLIGRDRMVQTLPAGNAVLAFADPDQSDRVAVVQWQQKSGLKVSRLRPDSTR